VSAKSHLNLRRRPQYVFCLTTSFPRASNAIPSSIDLPTGQHFLDYTFTLLSLFAFTMVCVIIPELTQPLQEPDSSRKDRQKAKKNRLGATEEEVADDSAMLSTSPPASKADAMELSKSPPHDVKMKHISRRVSGIQWKNGDHPETAETPADLAGASASVTDLSRPVTGAASMESVGAIDFPPSSSGLKSYSSMTTVADEPLTQDDAPESEKTSRHRSMDSFTSLGGLKRSREDNGDGREPKRTSSTDELIKAAEPINVAADADSILKRRSTESIRSVTSIKRQREDPAHDENPRETKRPSPPPVVPELPKDPVPRVATPPPASTTVSD
jgi:hypothetical protein